MITPRARILYLLITIFVLFFLFFPHERAFTYPPVTEEYAEDPTPSLPKTKALVVAALKRDDVSWIKKYLREYDHFIYIVDAAARGDTKSLTVPRNKGREANVYLTFIIDNYHNLPDSVAFIHSLRYQWHNEDPMYDGLPILKNLRTDFIKANGYTSLRCTWSLGCPAELKPTNPHAFRQDDRSATEEAYAKAFVELFPEREVPNVVGVTCGGQFAVSGEQIRKRPKEDYERYRQWLMDTTLQDSISGRILEYSWHIIFGREPVHCPVAKECFCGVFGLCNLECKNDQSCEKRYILAPYSTIPYGWPEQGPGENGWPERGWAD